MTKISRRVFLQGAALGSLSANAVASSNMGQRETTFDFVVAGAGHNSLITAAYLSKAGFGVVVLEGRPTIGGGCKTAEVCMPGFKEDLCSSVHGFIQSNLGQKRCLLFGRDKSAQDIAGDIARRGFGDQKDGQ